MEIIKQLYDIVHLFEEVENLEATEKSFSRIAEVELSYRGLEHNSRLICEDVHQTSLCLATRGVEGKGDFTMLQRGISRIKSYGNMSGIMATQLPLQH